MRSNYPHSIRYPSHRAPPVLHHVHSYSRVNGHVDGYSRGSGKHHTSSDISPIAKHYAKNRVGYKIMPPSEATKYQEYLSNSLHGELALQKYSEPISLKLINIHASDIAPLTVDRPEFENSVLWHIDAIRNGRTVNPPLVHFVPNADGKGGVYQVLDGNARCEAYRRLGISSYPVVENSILSSLASGALKGAALVAKGVSAAAGVAQKVVSPITGYASYRVGTKIDRALYPELFDPDPAKAAHARANFKRTNPQKWNDLFGATPVVQYTGKEYTESLKTKAQKEAEASKTKQEALKKDTARIRALTKPSKAVIDRAIMDFSKLNKNVTKISDMTAEDREKYHNTILKLEKAGILQPSVEEGDEVKITPEEANVMSARLRKIKATQVKN